MNTAKPVRLLSCDMHLEHWPTVLKGYVPAKYNDMLETAPLSFNLWGQLPFFGPEGITLSVMAGHGRFSEVRPGSHDIRRDKIPGAYGGAKEYLGWMDQDGVEAGIILPGLAIGSTMGAAKGSGDREGFLAFLQGYNNFLSDFCSHNPDRLLGGAAIPTTGIDDAIAELRRVSKLPGIRTISPGAFPNGSNTPKPEDDRFWAEALTLGMPVTFHGGISSPVFGLQSKQDAAAWVIGQTETTTGGPFSAAQLILSGVFDRFPELRVIILECGAGWLPFMMDEMNHMYDRQRFWAGFDLKNPPGWYCTSGNLLWNLINDHTAIKLRDDIGIGNLTWAADFPHSNSNFPRSRASAMDLTAPLTSEERYKVLWQNAADFYHIKDKA